MCYFFQAGVADNYVDAILVGHFEFGDDISNREVLINCAIDAGLEHSAALAGLDCEEARCWVRDEDARAQGAQRGTSV